MRTHILKCNNSLSLLTVINRCISKGCNFKVNGLTIRYWQSTRSLTNRLPKGTFHKAAQGKASYRYCSLNGKFAGLCRLTVDSKTYTITTKTLLNLEKKAGVKIPFIES